jgi:two-component system NtrC family sensor kinase
LLIALTPLLIVTGVVMDQYRDAYEAKTYAHLTERVQKHARLIDIFLQERLGDIRFLAQAFDGEALTRKPFLQRCLDLLRKECGSVFTDMGVVEIGPRGRQINYAGPFQLENALYGKAGWFQIAAAREHFISDTFMGLRGFPHFIVAARKRWGGGDCIVRATVDFTAFDNLVKSLKSGVSGYAFIINRAGSLQAGSPGVTPLPGNAEVNTLFELADNQTFLSSSEDNAAFYVTALIKNGAWLLVYHQTKADIFSQLRRTHKIAFAALFIGSVAIVCTALYLPLAILLKTEQGSGEQKQR